MFFKLEKKYLLAGVITDDSFLQVASLFLEEGGKVCYNAARIKLQGGVSMSKPIPGKDGNRYVPYEQRTGEKSVVFFTRDLSEAGLKKIFDRVSAPLTGKVAVKLHTGEAQGPNIIPRPWVKELMAQRLPGATIVETNTYYEGSRYTTEQHRETLKINGWTFCPVDITDEEGVSTFPVKGGKWFKEMHVGRNLENYDSLLALTHFKGHAMGGFGGTNKNLGIGCADGRIGKAEIHSTPDNMWGIAEEELMERIAESTKATVDHFAGHVSFINVMRNMSVSCDCEGPGAEPVVTPDVGILASLDVLALDQASIDLIYALPGGGGKAMIERVETRHGLRQLSYMKELGMGNDRYTLVDIDNADTELTAAEAVKDIAPGWEPDAYNTFPGRNKVREHIEQKLDK
jgi:uncharacterized Fe-S center protein